MRSLLYRHVEDALQKHESAIKAWEWELSRSGLSEDDKVCYTRRVETAQMDLEEIKDVLEFLQERQKRILEEEAKEA